MTYCKDGSVINDHCCCDGSVNGKLTMFFYLLKKSYTMQNFLYSILHYTFNVAMIMKNGTITLISNRFLCFTFYNYVACVFRRVLHRFTCKNRSKERAMCVRTIRAWRIDHTNDVGLIMQHFATNHDNRI